MQRKINKKKHWRNIATILMISLGVICMNGCQSDDNGASSSITGQIDANLPDWIDSQIIPVDGTSRRGQMLEAVNDIVIHYVGNPGTTAQNNHDYYTNADSTVSSHFVVGLEGEIIQCVPLDEKSSATNDRNRDTISIEVCHPDETGKFNDATYQSVVKLTAYLLNIYNLTEEHIIRHYDVTGKLCPLYFVEHEDAWEQFKVDVANYRANN
ncbi:MAG: N-acetylmuramoyl-L-alanine amidase family protein [Lachnospiraceae bacterium]